MAEFEGTRARPPEIRAKWFVTDETIGIGKIRLLETVGKLGSISAAARHMGMGYKRAWFLIASLQKGFNAPLIETVRGGNTHVCALVNAFGIGISFTCGVVSATGRSNVGFNEKEDFVQTDAAVNPGASGGALVRADGQLVGMIDGIFTKEADIDAGVNFAVSLPMIEQSLDAMRVDGVRF